MKCTHRGVLIVGCFFRFLSCRVPGEVTGNTRRMNLVIEGIGLIYRKERRQYAIEVGKEELYRVEGEMPRRGGVVVRRGR